MALRGVMLTVVAAALATLLAAAPRGYADDSRWPESEVGVVFAPIETDDTGPSPAVAAAQEAVPGTPAAASFGSGPPAIDVPILVYHTVKPGPPPSSPMARLLTVSPDELDRQFKFLRDNGYRTISFTDLADFLEHGTALPERPVIISFDDGWNNQFANAYPLLQRYGFTATFYVVTDYLDHQNFMTTSELRTMAAAGMTIGSHTRSHPALPGIGTPRRLLDEIAGSKAFLESRLGVAVDTFAYPYGAYNASVVAAVRAAGYRTARTVDFGANCEKARLLALPGLTFSIFIRRYRANVEFTSGMTAR